MLTIPGSTQVPSADLSTSPCALCEDDSANPTTSVEQAPGLGLLSGNVAVGSIETLAGGLQFLVGILMSVFGYQHQAEEGGGPPCVPIWCSLCCSC